MAENVLIDFTTDTSKLTPAVDQLDKMGQIQKDQIDNYKATNTEIQKQVKALDALNATTANIGKNGVPLKKTIADLNTQVKGLSQTFMQDFKQGATDALKEAGVSTEEFASALEKADGNTESLRQQLRNMVETLAQMKAAGQDNTAQYQELAIQAGELKKAISNANLEVRNFGSDTSSINGLINLTQGVAGGFALVTGGAALFGAESKNLQQSLLRVNSAMAVLQGLQQVSLLFQKESAAAVFANTIAIRAQTAAQVLYNFVVGTSVGLMKVLRIALAATGIGLLIFAVVELVEAFKKENEELRRANENIKAQTDLMEAFNKGVDEAISLEQARAEASGAAQSKINKIQAQGLAIQAQNIANTNKDLIKLQSVLSSTSEAWFLYNDAITKNNEAIDSLNTQLAIKSVQIQKQQAEEAKQALVDLAQARQDAAKKNSAEDFASQKVLEKAKAALEIQQAGENSEKIVEIHAALNKKLRDIDRAAREQAQKDVLSDLNTQLLKVQDASKAINERTTQEEIDLQKQIVLTKAKFDADAEGLSQKQILEIKRKGLSDALKLQHDFNKQSNKEAAEDQISRNNAELAALNISEKDKLSLITDNLILQADIELEANQGIAPKIKEINAKLDADIKAARLASIQATLEQELELYRVNNEFVVDSLTKALSDQDTLRSASSKSEEQRLERITGIQRLTLQEQLDAINKLTLIDFESNQKKIAALNEEHNKRLLSDKDYNTQYNALIDDQTKIVEDAEKKKTAIILAESDKRRQEFEKELQDSIDVAQEVVSVLSSIFDGRTASENASIERQKQQLKDLQEAGAITEKEAIIRQKRIDAEDRKNKQVQAQRDKTIAIFNAAIAIPQAFLKGLEQGGIILAAIYGGLAAVQLALVASRPIPKFGKGKKNRYQGFAEVGETGAELIESNGRMFVASKPQVVWLGAQDKVFNPKETAAMLSHEGLNTERVIINGAKAQNFTFDYDKMGKAFAEHAQTNVYVDGVQEQALKKQQFTSWLTKRRSW